MVCFVLFCFCFLGLHLQHMEVPRLGVKPVLRLPVYTAATATWYLSRVCSLHHSSRQQQIHHSSRQQQIHCARPGIDPVSTWILVEFVTAAP